MNVNDVQVEIPEGDMLVTIFNHQRDLMDKYHTIEENIVGHTIPSNPHENDKLHWQHAGALNIQDRASQLRFKDFAWRITEELTEATEVLPYQNNDQAIHFLEELIDALHFSVELCCMSGVIPSDNTLPDILESLFRDNRGVPLDMRTYSDSRYMRSHVYSVIEKLGEAMNRLKLKPWKVTAMLTDEPAYKKSIYEFFLRLIYLLSVAGFTAKSATQMYLNKNAVNQFRIRSKY